MTWDDLAEELSRRDVASLVSLEEAADLEATVIAAGRRRTSAHVARARELFAQEVGELLSKAPAPASPQRMLHHRRHAIAWATAMIIRRLRAPARRR